MLRKIIGAVLMICGIAIVVYAIYNRIYYDNINNSLVEEYERENLSLSEVSGEEAVLGDFKEGTNRDMSQSDTVYPTFDENIGGIDDQNDITSSLPVKAIGIISIAKIGLKAAIAEGSDYYIIRYSVGHFENTPLPSDGGNFCILGHRSYTYGQFFNRVEELDIGDIIDINIDGVGYSYQIYDIYVTEPTDVSVLDNSQRNEITVVTCTKDGNKRVIVKGIMLEYD